MNEVWRVIPAEGNQPERTITISERIVALLEQGNYLETAARSVGIHRDTLFGWLDVARNARDKAPSRRTKHENECVAFSDAVEAAQGQAEAKDLVLLEGIARGGLELRTEVVKQDPQGQVLAREVRTETTLPDAKVITWRLERRFPDRWGRRRLELTGADGQPIQVELTEEQGQQMAAVLQGTLTEVLDAVRRELLAGTLTPERLDVIEAEAPTIFRQVVERVVG
jgi:hypothetical protein